MNKPQITASPFLTFEGNCRDAMTFYKDSVKGELEIMPFEGAPLEYPPDMKDKVLHSSLKFGDALIMASDSMPGAPVIKGNNNSISISHSDVAEGERIFNALSVGGNVIMPFADAFWGARFGMVVDKFGVNWMVNCELKKPE